MTILPFYTNHAKSAADILPSLCQRSLFPSLLRLWHQDLKSQHQAFATSSLIGTKIQCLHLTAEHSPWSSHPSYPHPSDIYVMNKLSRLCYSLSKSLGFCQHLWFEPSVLLRGVTLILTPM